jgi:superfamily II DNA or RNA helicase
LFKAIQDAIKNYIENQKKIPVIIFDEAHLLKNEIFVSYSNLMVSKKLYPNFNKNFF